MLEKIIKNLPWKDGRQEMGYKKIKLFESQRLLCDCYLLYYPEGSQVQAHFDKVDFGKHYRLNIVIKKANEGGDFVCENPIWNRYRVNLFRPDISEHYVKKIKNGYRIVFSVGWIIR